MRRPANTKKFLSQGKVAAAGKRPQRPQPEPPPQKKRPKVEVEGRGQGGGEFMGRGSESPPYQLEVNNFHCFGHWKKLLLNKKRQL